MILTPASFYTWNHFNDCLYKRQSWLQWKVVPHEYVMLCGNFIQRV